MTIVMTPQMILTEALGEGNATLDFTTVTAGVVHALAEQMSQAHLEVQAQAAHLIADLQRVLDTGEAPTTVTLASAVTSRNYEAAVTNLAALRVPLRVATRAYKRDRQMTAQRRAAERAGKPYPMAWGARIDEHHYFCGACWENGNETGAHPDDHSPCDPPPFAAHQLEKES